MGLTREAAVMALCLTCLLRVRHMFGEAGQAHMFGRG